MASEEVLLTRGQIVPDIKSPWKPVQLNPHPQHISDPRDQAHSTSPPNARIEQINTQIRLIARRAFGFHSPKR